MKIVCLLGSPRPDGVSSTIAKRFAKTATSLGADTCIFELNTLHYRGCQACYDCKIKFEKCALKDDLTEVLDQVQEADIVVFASPVYYGDVSSQLKGFIDRTFSYLLPDYRTNPQPSRLSPKKLIFILTQGHPDRDKFADIFPRYQELMTWLRFDDIRLIRARNVGLGNIDVVPERVLRKAEEMAHSMLA